MRYLLLAPLVLLGLASAQAAELTAAVDRQEISLNERVVLTISLVNSDIRLRAEGISPNVDLSVLTKDFDLGTPQVQNRYNIFRGRGRSTSTLSVDLFPHRAGRYTIPAFSIDGLSTAPITVVARKRPAGTAPEIFSRGGVSKQVIWQREQFVAWLDVYHRVPLKSASIGEYIATEPPAIELMEHRELPQSERKETMNGVSYDVTRIAWAIFPKQSGVLTIHLPDVWIVAADDRKLRLPHQQQQVTVKALPAEVTEDIAVGKPSLAQTVPSPAPSINNISSWAVTVRGPFSRFALPDTLPLAPVANVRMYSDHAQRDAETDNDGVTTVITYTLSALPQRGGTLASPPLRVPYFDSGRGVMDLVELPGVRLDVPDLPIAAPEPAATNAANFPQQTGDAREAPAQAWQIATVIFAMLWITTLLALWKRLRPQTLATDQPTTPAIAPLAPTNRHPLQARLLAAFARRTLEQGLNAWEAQHGIDQQLRGTVRAVQQLCYGNADPGDINALSLAVDAAIAEIRGRAPSAEPAANDPWRPEAFAVDPSRH